MTKDLLGYESMVETALRGVVQEALRRVARDGLQGSHQFYLSFRTDHPGVEIAEALRAQHPDEMTIVLQNQFWDLEVDDDRFRVTLNFNKLPHQMEVPFAALTGFADPGVNFGLRFGASANQVGAEEAGAAPAAATEEPPTKGEPPEGAPEAKPAESADKIVTLDTFRKK